MKWFLKYNILLRVIALAFLVCSKTLAQDVTFTATASKTTVGAGEQFQISFSVNGNGTKFQAPTFRDFDLLMGPNQSMSTQITNGGMTQTVTYSYILIAQKEGSYDIPPASIEVNGKRL